MREDLVMTSAYDFCPSVQTVRVGKGRLHRGEDVACVAGGIVWMRD